MPEGATIGPDKVSLVMTDCPSAETVAAFVDGRLTGSARRDVVEHLAECGDCRNLVNDVVDFQAEEEPAEIARPQFGRRRFATVAASLAAAAALIVVFATPIRERIFGGGMSSLVKAAQSVSVRPTEGRLSGEFDYKPPKERFRGGDDEDAQLWPVMAEAAELESSRRRDLHALGVAHLYLGHHDQAIAELRRALQDEDDEEDRTAIAADLAAALIARRDERDAEEAHALMERAWPKHKTPAVAWNRAAALEALHRDAEAVRAWDDYLQLDPNSPWSKEAKHSRDTLASR